jgi:hypothetical protein
MKKSGLFADSRAGRIFFARIHEARRKDDSVLIPLNMPK